MEEEKAGNFLRRKVNFWLRRRKTVKKKRKIFGEGEDFLWRKEKEKEKKSGGGREGKQRRRKIFGEGKYFFWDGEEERRRKRRKISWRRKNCCGLTGIEGSIRGPRGP